MLYCVQSSKKLKVRRVPALVSLTNVSNSCRLMATMRAKECGMGASHSHAPFLKVEKWDRINFPPRVSLPGNVAICSCGISTNNHARTRIGAKPCSPTYAATPTCLLSIVVVGSRSVFTHTMSDKTCERRVSGAHCNLKNFVDAEIFKTEVVGRRCERGRELRDVRETRTSRCS